MRFFSQSTIPPPEVRFAPLRSYSKDDMTASKKKSAAKPKVLPAPHSGANQPINEADFQAAIIARLRQALPLLPANIRAERYLNLKLGHHHIAVDGSGKTRDFFKGRSDVVMLLDDTPLLLAELKAPSVAITDEDVDQGLSYARIHQPMVPLVLVTNGDQASTRLVLTYDGTTVSSDKADAAGLEKILLAASNLARSSTEGAIRSLLGRDPKIWGAILKKWNAEEISSRTGAIPDLHRAIAEGFQIPRQAVGQICNYVERGAKVVVLHGAPLSGITGTLIQLIEKLEKAPVLYVDRRSSGDILQFLSSRLTRELSIGVSRDDVRQWLITGQSLAGLILVVDGVPTGELEELLHLAELKRLQLVFGTDSGTFESHSTLAGRIEETMLGRLATPVELEDLSNEEFGAARELFVKLKYAHFLTGAQLIPDLRRPRQLRLIASLLPRHVPKRKSATDGSRYETRLVIPPIPDFRMLERASNLIGADPQLKHDLSKLAAAYLVDVTEHGRDQLRIIETYGAPSIDPDILERSLGEQRIERLRRNGVIHWIDTRTLGPRLVVRFPEQLAHNISAQWAADLNKQTDADNLNTTLQRILQQSRFVPEGDLCVAAAISRVTDGNHLFLIVNTLIAAEPEPTFLTEGSTVEILAKDVKGVRIQFGEGMNERLPGDMQPWLILSHLAMTPMDTGDDGTSVNLLIVATLGNSEDLIFKPAPRDLRDTLGLHTHDIPGVGSVLCVNSGIVEPLMQAMYLCASHRPDELHQLVTHALQEDKRHLAWRLVILCSLLRNDSDPKASAAARAALQRLDKYWKAFIASDDAKNDKGSA